MSKKDLKKIWIWKLMLNHGMIRMKIMMIMIINKCFSQDVHDE